MRNILTVFKRELGAYFNSAIAYIYLVVFITLNNGLFMAQFFLAGKADMRPYFNLLPFVLLVFIPVITMRLWAEDRKENTFELLMTFPMKPAELVLGKFFASFVFYMVALASTVTVPLMLFMVGRPDLGTIVGDYVGVILLGALFLSVGIFVSGLTQEQIVAFVVTATACFLIYFFGTDFFATFLDGWFSGLGTFLKNYVGAASHLLSLYKGVVDVKDVLYFVVGCFVFLLLNGFSFEGRLRRKARLVFSAAVAVCFIGAIVLNWLVHDLSLPRFDLTQNKIYTIAEATKRILNDLKAPVQIKVYLTPAEKMPTALKTLEQEIVGKLDELRIVSKNKLNYRVVHIEAANLVEQAKNQPGAAPKASLEKTLSEKGIMPFQVESIDRDEVGVKLIYSALSIAFKEKNEEILPRILPNTLSDLEYLLLSRIKKMAVEERPKVALFSPLTAEQLSPEMVQVLTKMGKPVAQYEDEYQSLVPLLRNNAYDVARISLTKNDPLPSGLKVLLVLNVANLNDRQIYEINKFLYQGGSVVIAAQGYDYSFQLFPSSGLGILPRKLNLDINKLIQKWGIKINEDMLMDESSELIDVSTGQRVGPFSMSIPVRAANQIRVRDESINKKVPLMSRLSSLFYLWGSALDVSEDVVKQSGLKKSILFSSSNRSWKVPFEGGNLTPQNMQFPKTGSPGKFPLGLMLEGQFSDTFLATGAPDWPSEASTENKPAQTTSKNNPAPLGDAKPGKLIVLGCFKMFTDQLIANPGHLNLFANIIDSLALGDDIIQIRSKTPVSRDIIQVSDAQKVWYRLMNVGLMPLAWVIFCFIRLFIRRKEKQFYALARGQ
jgi:ABC-2 type transport system permease protein